MADRLIVGRAAPPGEIWRALLDRGAFATLTDRLDGCGAIEAKVAEAVAAYFRERRGEVVVSDEMRALRDLAAANRAIAGQVRRDHPEVAARLQEFADVAEGAISRAGRRGSAASRGREQLDHLIAGLFVIAWRTTRLGRAPILSGFVPAILRAADAAYPGEFPSLDRIDVGARFRRHLSGTLRWINTRLRKRSAPYSAADLIRHWEHLAFTDDDRFPPSLAGHRERKRGAFKGGRGAAGRS